VFSSVFFFLQAEALHAKYGYNEVTAKQTPEWKKILWRYLDWVSLVIVSQSKTARYAFANLQPLTDPLNICSTET
jgi:hypothetical protein